MIIDWGEKDRQYYSGGHRAGHFSHWGSGATIAVGTGTSIGSATVAGVGRALEITISVPGGISIEFLRRLLQIRSGIGLARGFSTAIAVGVAITAASGRASTLAVADGAGAWDDRMARLIAEEDEEWMLAA